MEIAARLSSKGQVTIPKPVRDALQLQDGDHVVFRVEHGHAVIARTPDLLDLADTVRGVPTRRGSPWDEVRRQTRAARALRMQ
jgi:antitoxin PrlF